MLTAAGIGAEGFPEGVGAAATAGAAAAAGNDPFGGLIPGDGLGEFSAAPAAEASDAGD